MEIKIQEIKGIDEFLQRIWELSVQKVINGSIKKSIISTEREARIETPVDLWELRRAYSTSFSNLEWRLWNYKSYAQFVHDWHKQTPGRYVWAIGKRLKANFVKWNPFMQRAIDNTEPKIEQIFRDDIEKFLIDLTK